MALNSPSYIAFSKTHATEQKSVYLIFGKPRVVVTVTSSSAPARCLTSTHKQSARKPRSSALIESGFFNVGVPLVAIKYRALSGSSSRYGGSFSIISIVMIPNDHISTFGLNVYQLHVLKWYVSYPYPYDFCFTTSGAIQYGVPTIVARLFFWSVNLAQKPKSAIAFFSKFY